MDEKLAQLHTLCLELQNVELNERLRQIAAFFLGTKYGPWIDGTTLESLDDFNYELNTLDCVTYVEVVLALAKLHINEDYQNFVNDFEDMLRKIHYADGVPSFLSRNHFFCIDWICNNKYITEDITSSLSNACKIAVANIDKANWIVRHKISANLDTNYSKHILQKIPTKTSNVPYIEITEFLNNYQDYVNKFPANSIVNIVRPNWNLTDSIGTHLNISHLGFAFKNTANTSLDFYHATVIQMQTVTESLYEYLQRYLDSPTIKGVNVLAISPENSYARK